MGIKDDSVRIEDGRKLKDIKESIFRSVARLDIDIVGQYITRQKWISLRIGSRSIPLECPLSLINYRLSTSGKGHDCQKDEYEYLFHTSS